MYEFGIDSVAGTGDTNEEVGIPNVQVALTDGFGGLHTVVTDAEGYYSTLVPTGPIMGDVLVEVDQSTIPASSVYTGMLDPNVVMIQAGDPSERAVGEMDSIDDFDGYLLAIRTGTISGTVYQDTGATPGMFDIPGDAPIGGVSVTLYNDVNSSGAFDAGDTIVGVAQITDAMTGAYTFTNVPAGSYVVFETDPAGFGSVAENDNLDDDGAGPVDDNTILVVGDLDFLNVNDNSLPVILAAGETDTANDFLDVRQAGTLALTKVAVLLTNADDSIGTGAAATISAGDTVRYTFIATNTGNVGLTNVLIDEAALVPDLPMPGNLTPIGSCQVNGTPPVVVNGMIALPNTNDYVTCTALYTVPLTSIIDDLNTDLSDGVQLPNRALVTGTPPSGPMVTDGSDDPTDPTTTTDDPTVIDVRLAPVANNDQSLGNAPGLVPVNILINDVLEDGLVIIPANHLPTEVTVMLDETSVPGGVAGANSVTVPGEGVWTYVPATGILTFVPEVMFAGDPSILTYLLTEKATGLSDTATVTITYQRDFSITVNKTVISPSVGGSGVEFDLGATVTYRVTATNNGNSQVNGVVVGDTHPNAVLVNPSCMVTDNMPTGDSSLQALVMHFPGSDTGGIAALGVGDEFYCDFTLSVNATSIVSVPIAPVPMDNVPPLSMCVVNNTGTADSTQTALVNSPSLQNLVLPQNNNAAVDDLPQQVLRAPNGAIVVSVNVLLNDTDTAGNTPALPVNVQVDLNPITSIIETTLTVPGDVNFLAGTWEVDANGLVTFTSDLTSFPPNSSPMVRSLKYRLVEQVGDCTFEDTADIRLDIRTTPVTMAYFYAEGGVSGQVDFNWKTELEVGTIGFNIYTREANDWVLVNDGLILSGEAATLDGADYFYTAHNVIGEWFAVSEVSSEEEVTVHGPYRLNHEYGEISEDIVGMDWERIRDAFESRSTDEDVGSSVEERLRQLLEADERVERQ
jgi:uncharacterized repeat protein (TIGR01451 family)